MPLTRSQNMARIHGKDTKPEIRVRKALHAKGFRFRVNVRSLSGTPDIVLPKYRTCVFVNGCFWHGHDKCSFYSRPKSNKEFWQDKVKRNKARDELVVAKLSSMGWYCVSVWECELKKAVFEKTMEALAATIRGNRERWEQEKDRKRQERMQAKERKTLSERRQQELMLKGVSPAIVRLSKEDSDEL